jgi:tRNA-dihydrouridine synthase B
MKLDSREMGSVFLAPLSGVGDSPFRRICKGFGAEVVYSEMISAVGLAKANWRSRAILKFYEDERPIGVQIFGRDPAYMGVAARLVGEVQPDFIDINFSCPASKIVSRGAGAALLREPELIGPIARAVVAGAGIPVTAKIRLGWDHARINAVEIGRILEDAGVKAVSVHGRTWEQGFRDLASWEEIAQVKRVLGIPVILSGDVRTAEDGVRAFAETGCDALMVGRGCFGRPWVFAAIRAGLEGGSYVEPGFDEVRSVLLRHLDLGIEEFGERIAVRRFRKHLLWYTKGLRGVVSLRQQMGITTTRDDVVALLTRLVESEVAGSGGGVEREGGAEGTEFGGQMESEGWAEDARG